ncbi:phage tail protein [Hymenobacter sp. AT01-02]|uniref:phage tail protein n=1 Tax=Hymenobacter sp. AT01-02 TaxID=1571877 RepID=UPI001F297DC3|nr:tail fiber protein [Hymenobacter sp. AT01-02]
MFGFNFVPNGWAACNGQLLSVSENNALFSLLGTTYGGNGQTTFALPNLAGRFPLGFGQSFSGASHVQGEMAGTETVTLTTSQMPAHTHSMTATTVAGNTNNPNGALLANDGAGGAQFSTAGTSDVTMQSTSIGPAGGNQPQNNMPPYLALNFCIALQGIYPSRG